MRLVPWNASLSQSRETRAANHYQAGLLRLAKVNLNEVEEGLSTLYEAGPLESSDRMRQL
jgi:hypothetical protein